MDWTKTVQFEVSGLLFFVFSVVLSRKYWKESGILRAKNAGEKEEINDNEASSDEKEFDSKKTNHEKTDSGEKDVTG